MVPGDLSLPLPATCLTPLPALSIPPLFQPHDHGFVASGSEVRTAEVTHSSEGMTVVEGGVRDLAVLKTTQSGYAGFLHDRFTTLPDTDDRIVATRVRASWRYTTTPLTYDDAYEAARAALLDQFFGPVKGGVFSPSVQFTLYHMAGAVLQR